MNTNFNIIEKNILKDPGITSVHILYFNGKEHFNFPVKAKFMDDNDCYFETELPANFAKPKKNIEATIIVNTGNGVYTSSTKIVDITLSSFTMLTFNVRTPKKWNFKKLNVVIEQKFERPLSIKFNDGYEIKGVTSGISYENIVFKPIENIPDLYTRFVAKLTVELSDEDPQNKFHADVKFLRTENDLDNEKGYVFRFVNISPDDLVLLKNIIKIA